MCARVYVSSLPTKSLTISTFCAHNVDDPACAELMQCVNVCAYVCMHAKIACTQMLGMYVYTFVCVYCACVFFVMYVCIYACIFQRVLCHTYHISFSNYCARPANSRIQHTLGLCLHSTGQSCTDSSLRNARFRTHVHVTNSNPLIESVYVCKAICVEQRHSLCVLIAQMVGTNIQILP
jgi:hypothetical protein